MYVMRIVHAMESRLDGLTNRTANRSIPMMFRTTLENITKTKKTYNSTLRRERREPNGEKLCERVYNIP